MNVELRLNAERSSLLNEQLAKTLERLNRVATARAIYSNEVAEVKNNAENLVYSTEKSLRDMGDRVDQATRDEIEAAAVEVRKALDTENIDDIKAKTDVLMQASHKLAEAVYQLASGDPKTRTGRIDYAEPLLKELGLKPSALV